MKEFTVPNNRANQAANRPQPSNVRQRAADEALWASRPKVDFERIEVCDGRTIFSCLFQEARVGYLASRQDAFF